MNEVTVVMPTFEHAAFIGRAIVSLFAQTFDRWELVIVDDGSEDATGDVVAPYLSDSRVRYHRFESNRGIGAALNFGIGQARGQIIAYLPSDDVYYPEHLASLLACLQGDDEAVAAVSGVRHHYNRSSRARIDGYPLQLVQVAHRRGPDRWLEREQLVTDDLDRMFWSALGTRGSFAQTGLITAEWVDHPGQRHKVLQEPVGGINPYRQRYRVQAPLRFHSTVGNCMDEVHLYGRFRERPDTPPASDRLKILLVGELAYNAERVLALEERGHKLYGLWMPQPYWYNTVGPVPFGHVEDLPPDDWQAAIRRVQPDVIYALLNWQAVPFVRQVLANTHGIPFIWHFKEGPFICLEKGTWNDLVAIYHGADGLVFSSPEMRDWFAMAVPETVDHACLALDGDLPKREWFTDDRAPRLSRESGEIHTVVPGRPIGLHPETVRELADEGVHLHFYGDFTHGQWRPWIERSRRLAGRFLHLHGNVSQDCWVEEFSRYDAGWLHFFASENEGDLRRANWDDLNYPARLATLMAAGLPVLQRDNRGSVVATDALARALDIGLFFSDMAEAASQLRNEARMAQLRQNVWASRPHFTFDAHADELLAFFRAVIADRRGARRGTARVELER